MKRLFGLYWATWLILGCTSGNQAGNSDIKDTLYQDVIQLEITLQIDNSAYTDNVSDIRRDIRVDTRPDGFQPYDPGYTDNPAKDQGFRDPGITDPGHDPGFHDSGIGDTGHNDVADAGPALDCKGLYNCIDACPKDQNGYAEQSCRDNCNSRLTDQGKQINDALLQCLKDNQCTFLTGDAFSECLEKHCQDQYFRCFSGDQYQTCRALVACRRSCPKDDPATTDKDEYMDCAEDCYQNATYDANWDWEHFRTCLLAACQPDANGNLDPTCVNQQITSNCYNQADKCLPHGASRCDQLWTCLNQCGANDSNCVQQCYDNATYTAQFLYNDMLQCALDNCKSQCGGNDNNACNTCLNQQIGSGGTCYSKKLACQNDQAVR